MSNYSKYLFYKLISIIAFIMPFFVLFALNKSMFIVKNVTSISLYGYISLIFVFSIIKDKITIFGKNNLTLPFSIALFITAIMMKNFYQQLIIISIAGIIGSVLSQVFSPIEKVFYYQCYEIKGDSKLRITTPNLTHKEGWKRAYLWN